MLYVIDTYAAETYMELNMTRLQTVVELPEFQRRAKAIMSDQEREAAINFIAANPEAGISLGGGLRKVRIPREGSGKSGGFRTVYVFGGTHMPIFLITVFAKNEKTNLSKTEQAAAVEMSKALVAKYGDAISVHSIPYPRAWKRRWPLQMASWQARRCMNFPWSRSMSPKFGNGLACPRQSSPRASASRKARCLSLIHI